MKYLFFCFIFISCAQMQQNFIKNYCHYEGAYSLGLNDQQNGHEMLVQRLSSCPEESHKEALKGYKEGYTKSLTESNKETNIYIGNRSNYRKRYFCKSKAFTETYSAFGPTKLEAKELALARCSKNHHKMHCKILKCEINK